MLIQLIQTLCEISRFHSEDDLCYVPLGYGLL
jgi:hypothetical protein